MVRLYFCHRVSAKINKQTILRKWFVSAVLNPVTKDLGSQPDWFFRPRKANDNSQDIPSYLDHNLPNYTATNLLSESAKKAI